MFYTMDLAMPYGIIEQTVATSATAKRGIFDFYVMVYVLH